MNHKDEIRELLEKAEEMERPAKELRRKACDLKLLDTLDLFGVSIGEVVELKDCTIRITGSKYSDYIEGTIIKKDGTDSKRSKTIYNKKEITRGAVNEN